MPGILGGIIFGLIGGLFGSIVMAIIMMAMGKKVTPPGILAEKFFGDEGKKPMVLMPVMAAWGAIFGALVASGTLAAGYVSGFIVAGVAWAMLNIVMLPMAGAGILGMKKDAMLPVMSLIMHAVWAGVAVTTYNILAGIIG